MTIERTWRGDLGLAAALAGALGLAWTTRDWAALSRLALPDTDDLIRLQQVRDWLGGQAWGDLAQHRLGVGLPMHWSRLADLGPAGLIAGLAPLIGRHAAEVAAVIAWPLLLFAAALFLVARIARAAGADGAGRTALLIGAVAFPATTVFLPGRIDHHGLQLVLLLGAVLGGLQGRGPIVGLLAAASLVVGMELTPLFAALAGAMLVDWAVAPDRPRADRKLLGLGLGALVGLLVGRLLFAGSGWDYPACDAFDARSWRAAGVLALAPCALALLPLDTRAGRIGAGAALCGGAALVALLLSPECLSPYGGVGDELRRAWLSNVEEAQGLLSAPPTTSFGHLGLALAGLVAGGWAAWRTRSAAWGTLLLVQLAAVAVACVQLRGAYAAAILAAPALAAAVAAARTRGAWPLVGAWLASAGLLYPLTASAVAPEPASTIKGGDCASPALLARLAALPPGVVMAPLDANAAIIAATPHQAVAAPYHRNGRAILDSFRFYRGDHAEAARIARAWRVDYALACAGWPARGRVVATLPDGAAIIRP